jgi:hypothetical protein
MSAATRSLSGRAAPAAAGAERADSWPLLSIAIVVATLLVLFGPGVLEHARYAADPWRFNDDARALIWPFLRYADPDLFRADYLADYWLAFMPRGYRLLYALSAPVVDPRTLSKALPYIELLITLYALLAATWVIAGPAAAWGTGALCLASDVLLWRMAGGLPRSFAFPLVALAMLAVVRGKPWCLCVLSLLGAALYFPVAVLLVATTAVYLLLAPPSWRGDARPWSLARRIAVLAATAALAALIVLPTHRAGRPFGPLIYRADLAAFPEATSGGRYDDLDLPLPGQLPRIALRYTVEPLLAPDDAWDQSVRDWSRRIAKRSPALALGVGAALLAVFALLIASSAATRPLLALFGSAVGLYALGLALWPRLLLPARYLTYSLPLLTVVVLPAALAALVRQQRLLRAHRHVSTLLVVAIIALFILVAGGRGPGSVGLTKAIPQPQRPLYAFLATLPDDALIAGWPNDIIDNVPYLSARRVLGGYETHQAFHTGETLEMRRRMEALIEAYFATEPAPLLRLQRELGVTHLLVNRDHYGRKTPTYFKPFDTAIARAAQPTTMAPETLRQVPTAAVFEVGPFIVLDLQRVGHAGP